MSINIVLRPPWHPRGLTLTIADGEFLTLLGPSGAGKTTLLRLIAGLEQPSAGHLRLNGDPLGSCPPAERNVGMVFQTPNVLPVSIHRNLAMPLKLTLGLNRSETDDRMEGRLVPNRLKKTQQRCTFPLCDLL